MAGHLKITSPDEPEEPELFRVRRPTSNQVGLYGLALGEAAQFAQTHQPGAAAVVAAVATGALLKACVRRRKR